jgi:hypothetical protein
MAAAGCSAEQIAVVVEAQEAARAAEAEAQREKRRAGNAERQRQKRIRDKESNACHGVTERDISLRSVTERDPSSDKEKSPTPSKEINSIQTSLRSETETRAREAFTEFRKIYPRRSGSQPWTPAEKKFLAICHGGVDPAEILDGVKAYAVAQAGGDPQFVAQAVTWLNQSRWKDDHQPAPQARAGPAIPPQNDRRVYIGVDQQKQLLDEYYDRIEGKNREPAFKLIG